MISDSRRKTLINKISRLEKNNIDIMGQINRRKKEFDKLEQEKNRRNINDSRKKTIISRQATIKKDLINLQAKKAKNDNEIIKANKEMKS